MEVVPVSGGGAVQLPFQRRNVEEWSRFDRLTGMLEHTRVETDQWAANTSSSTRKYGKVVDSRARNLADGSVQQRQRKQLEVFQEQVPGGSLQVIRTHSVTSTSSSSTSTNWRGPAGGQPNNFDSLQLSVNPLNFGPQKTKATVGRSGSIGGRRPPSRPRGIVAKVDSAISEEDPVPDVLNNLDNRSINSRLPEASRICQQIHEEAKKTTFGNTPSLYGTSGANFHDEIEIEVATPRIEQLQCSSTEDEDGDVKIEEISDNLSLDLLPESSIKHEQTQINGSIHKHVIRKKSSSTEDLHNTFLENKIEKKEDNGEDLDWRRTSLIRRSLQFPSKATQETSATPQRSVPIKFENGRVREGNALKGYEALESVFIRGANIADSVNKSMTYDRDDNESPFTDSLASHLRNESMSRQHSNSFGVEGFSRRTTNIHNNPPNKRHSFVTVESLKEVRGRLRRLSSPPLDGMQQQDCFHNIKKPVEDNDDGIVTEDTIKSLDNEEATTPSCVSSYVFGIKALSNSNSNVGRKAFPGTGSLESRTSNKLSGGGSNRSEEWYNRRKSYGFEQVHSHETDDHSSSIKFRDRNKVESSTDSGICRSSEAVTAPLWGRTVNQVEETDISKKQLTGHSHMNDAVLQVSHSIQIKKPQNEGTDMKKQPSEAAGSINEGRRTVVMLGNEFCSSNLGHRSHDNNAIIVHSSIMKDSSLSKNGFRTTSGDESNTNQLQNLKTNRDVRRLSEPVTITIPIVSEEKEENSSVESKRLFFRQLSEGTSLSVESSQDKPLFMNSSTHKDSPSSSFSRSSSQAGFLRGTWTSGDDWSNTSKILDSDLKRHSIAVDESKYMREGLRSYNHNETNKNNFEKELANVSTSELVKRFAALNSFKQEELSFSNKDSGSSSTSGINVSFIQNGEVLTNHDENTEELQQQNNKKQKKVEFCKTEVHFAAESGRFNIVETDEKPPPSNTFRRRRRISSANIGSIQAADSSKNNLPEVRFGDSPYEKKLLGGNENDNMKANLMDGINKTNVLSPLPKPETLRSVVLAMDEFQDDADKEDHIYTQANATIMTSLHHETSHMKSYAEESRDSSDRQVEQHNVMNVTQNEPLPRSILKNNKKPSFLLGENNDLMLDQGEDHDEKWGVRLRPVQSHKEHGSAAMWRSTVTLRSTAFESPQQQSSVKESKDLSNSSNGETELQKLLKSLRPAAQRLTVNDSIPSGSPKNSKGSPATLKKSNPENIKNGVQVKISATPPEIRHSMCSVADRIRQVEDLKHSSVETKGYSTRINFGAGEATVVETVSSDEQQNTSNNPPPPPPPSSCSTSLFQQSHQPKPIWLRREERKQDSMIIQGCSNPEIKDDEPQQCAVATAVLPSYDNNRLRTVETLVSTRSGQPKITSISLRYEGDQDLESGPTGGARCKDLLGYSGRNSCNDIQERKMKVHNQANEASVHHFSSKSQGHSVIKGKTSLLEDKVHSNSFVKSNELNFQSKLENKSPQLLDDMTYQKGKQSSCVMNDGFYKEKRQVSGRIHCEFQEQSYKAGRHDTTIENESMYIGRNRPSHLRERRSKSPEESTTHLYTNVLPSAGGRKSTYSPIKKSSSPITATIHYHDTEKDSIPPPATKSQANTASLVPQHSTHEVHVVKTMKENSNYSSVYSQESQCKPDVRKQNSANKAMKEHQSTNTSSVSKGRKTIKRLHGCDSEEMSLNTAQQTSAEKYQHDECNYTMGKKSSRAQAATHGRDQSPNKTPTNNEAVTLRNSFDHKTKRENHENPIYENSNAFSQDYNSKTLRRGKTEVGENESTILEELTRAADQILQAVNGYTDDESNRASSEDDEHGGRHRRGRKLTQVKRPSASLGTISETASTHKQKDGTKHGKTDLQKTGGYVKRTQRLSKVHVGQNSSTSSVESFTREVRRSSAGLLKKEGLSSMEDHSKRKLTSSGSVTKSGSRTARLLQRASSREMLLQAHASSSEDIMSGAEGGVNRKPRVPRRNRTHNTNMTKTSSLTSITSNTKKAPSPSSSAQHAPSLVTTRLKKKDDETLKGRERSSAPVSKVKTCATDHSKGQNVRTRDVLKTGQNDESHRKPSKRDGAEIKQRTVKEVTEKMAGNSFTPLSTCREKVDRNPSERRLVGNVGNSAVVRSSTSHVLAKRRPSSSRNEGLSQNKSSK